MLKNKTKHKKLTELKHPNIKNNLNPDKVGNKEV